MVSTRARSLRKNLTDAERKLWSVLRQRALGGHRFRRQHPLGPYVVDFVCLEMKLIVEVDGGQHAVDAERDRQRTDWLEARGYRVLRLWNNEVLSNLDGSVHAIRTALQSG